MIVVLVYRPEAADGPHQMTSEDDFDPWNGVEVYGIYYPAEEKQVVEMMDKLHEKHPRWNFHMSGGHKMKIGLSVWGVNV